MTTWTARDDCPGTVVVTDEGNSGSQPGRGLKPRVHAPGGADRRRHLRSSLRAPRVRQTHPTGRNDVAPTGLIGKEESVLTVRSPGFAPRAL